MTLFVVPLALLPPTSHEYVPRWGLTLLNLFVGPDHLVSQRFCQIHLFADNVGQHTTRVSQDYRIDAVEAQAEGVTK